MKNGNSREISALDSDYVATYDTDIYKIPRDAILVFAGSWHKDLGQRKPKFYIEKHHLSATINLFNALIKLGLGNEFLAIIADSLAANHETTDETELKKLRTKYTESGTAYKKANQSYFNRIALDANKKTITQWEEWRKGELFVEKLGCDGPTPIEKLRGILDKTESGNAEEQIAKINPSMPILIEYLNYLYEKTTSKHHIGFKGEVDNVIKEKLNKKVHQKFGNVQKKEAVKDIEKFKEEETPKIRNFLFEECAHHIMLGVLAHRLKRPIRIFYKNGMSKAMRFVQDTFIGINFKSGHKYLELINMQMFPKKESKTYYAKKSAKLLRVSEVLSTDDGYDKEEIQTLSKTPPKDSENSINVNVGASSILSMAMTMAGDENIDDLKFKKAALNKLINQKIKQEQTTNNDSKTTSPRYNVSLDPRPEELWAILIEHFSKDDTPIGDVKSLKDYIDNRIKSRENSPEMSPKLRLNIKNKQGMGSPEKNDVATKNKLEISKSKSGPIEIVVKRGGLGGMKRNPHNGKDSKDDQHSLLDENVM